MCDEAAQQFWPRTSLWQPFRTEGREEQRSRRSPTPFRGASGDEEVAVASSMSENDEVPVKRPSMKKPAAAKAKANTKASAAPKAKSKAVKKAAIKKKPSCKLSTDGKNGGDRGAPTGEPPSSADERQHEGTKDDAEKADEQGNDGATIKDDVALEANEKKVAQTESTSGFNKGGVKPRPGFRGCSKCRWKGSTCCQI